MGTRDLLCLHDTQDSVKAAQQWFMACGPACAAGLARMMAIRCVNGVSEFERKLHLIYLANDILFKGWVACCDDMICSACGWVLGKFGYVA
jgi:hypothetical protein